MIFALFYVVHFTPGCTVFHREAKRRHKLEPVAGFEPATSSLPRKCSTPELHRQYVKFRAEDEAQTRDPQLGRLMLYQLSYFRKFYCGQGQIRTAEAVRQQIYSLPVLTTYLPTQNFEPLVGFEPTTPRLQITCSGQLS